MDGADRGRARASPSELWDELRDRGYLRLAAPVAYGGRGCRSPTTCELLELFAMSHASLRMIVHVSNGIWRALDSHANDEQLERFVAPAVTDRYQGRVHADRADAGTGADIRCSSRARATPTT